MEELGSRRIPRKEFGVSGSDGGSDAGDRTVSEISYYIRVRLITRPRLVRGDPAGVVASQGSALPRATMAKRRTQIFHRTEMQSGSGNGDLRIDP